MNPVKQVLASILTIALAVGCADRITPPVPPAPPAQPPPPPAQPPPPPPGQPPPPPVAPGSAIVSLATPNSDDGALIITLRGPGISSLQTASSGYLFYSRLASEQDARVIVVGNVIAGPVFTFKPASGAELSAYTATIQEIANRNNGLRTASNYQLTITSAP